MTPTCLKCRRPSDKAQLLGYVHRSRHARARFYLCHRCGLTSDEVLVDHYALGSHMRTEGQVVESEVSDAVD